MLTFLSLFFSLLFQRPRGIALQLVKMSPNDRVAVFQFVVNHLKVTIWRTASLEEKYGMVRVWVYYWSWNHPFDGMGGLAYAD